MRADRLISIILLLQNHGKLTTQALAEKLEVTPRTIHRDMESLSGMGIPVVAERGAAGGWKLLEEYKTSLTGLTQEELQTLLISPSIQQLRELGIDKEWNAAREKLLASNPFRLSGVDVWNRILIDSSGWRAKPEELQTFQTLQDALWEEKLVHIRYVRADGEERERLVGPLGLVAKKSNWYMVAQIDDQIRTFRISRIREAVPTTNHFTRPAEFHLENYWEESTKQFVSSLPSFEVKVCLHPEIIPRATFTGLFLKQIELSKADKDGWVPATLTFDTEQEAAHYILGFSNKIRIYQPVSLKEKIYQMAKAVMDQYERLS